MRDLTFTQALQLRVLAQRLPVGYGLSDAGTLAVHICGLQAQDERAGTLAFRPRTTGLSATDIDHARSVARTVVRTWVMRNTLHYVAAKDVRWLQALLGPRAIRQTERRRAQLGLTPAVIDRALPALRTLLHDGPVTRPTLIAQLAEQGFPTEGQAAFHLLARAALDSLICFGPNADGKQTFVLVDDWLANTQHNTPADPLAELARRYLTAYAPATPADLAGWAGITLTDARAAFDRLGDTLVPVAIEGDPAWLLANQIATLDTLADVSPTVRLLPAFDTYLLGWQGRPRLFTAGHYKHIYPGGGILHPSLLVDGAIVGRWQIVRAKDELTVRVTPFRGLAASERRALEAEVVDVGRFLGDTAHLHLTEP